MGFHDRFTVTKVINNRAQTPPPVMEDNEVVLNVNDLHDHPKFLGVPLDFERRKSSLGQLTR